MKKLTISLLALITILSCGATTVSAARFRTYRYHTPHVRRTPRYRIRKSEYSYSHKMSSDHSSYSHHDNMSSYQVVAILIQGRLRHLLDHRQMIF